MEGVAEEEEVDDQLLWNLQILSEVRMYLFHTFALRGHLSVRTVAWARRYCLIAQNGHARVVNQTFLTKKNDCYDMTHRIISP